MACGGICCPGDERRCPGSEIAVGADQVARSIHASGDSEFHCDLRGGVAPRGVGAGDDLDADEIVPIDGDDECVYLMPTIVAARHHLESEVELGVRGDDEHCADGSAPVAREPPESG